MVTYLGAKSSKHAEMMGEWDVWSVDEISINFMKPVRTYVGPSIEWNIKYLELYKTLERSAYSMKLVTPRSHLSTW